jgi:3-oxoacyl-[acyl-carrier-protein] synthase II
MNRRVVVTGMGAVTPLGIGAGKLHAAAVRGESGIIDGIGRCTEFDGSKMLDRRDARRMDWFCQLAVMAAGEAIGQAEWTSSPPA